MDIPYLPFPSGVVQIAAGGLTSAAIADGAISNAKVADGAITDTKLADGCITANKIAAGALSNLKFTGTSFQGLLIRSLQRGTIGIAAGVNNGAAAINAVTLARSVVLHSGSRDDDTGGDAPAAGLATTVDLESTTSVRASREDGDTSRAITVAFQVLEFF